MDLSLLLLLCLCGLSVSQDILPEGPLDALVGGTIIFKTMLKNPEFAVIIWNFNDGEEVHPISTLTPELQKVDPKYEGRANIDANGTLTLTGLKDDESGQYSISILDKSYSQKAAEVELRVMVPVSDVKITSNVPDARELITQVTLTCSAKGSFLRFKWMNGTSPIVADGTRLKIERVDSSSVMSFSSVYRSDLVGPIVCEAFNTLSSEKSAPFNLTVYYGPEQVSIVPATPPEYLPSQSLFSLTCASSSDPPALINWFHNDQILEVSGPTLSVQDIEKHSLGKTKASYTCNATNTKTEKVVTSKPVSFTIIEKIEGLKLSAPTEKLFAGNSSANISCEAKGSMQTVKWLKNGAPLSASSRVVFSTDKMSVLINPLQKEDNAEFSCEISNPVSKEMNKTKLTVYYGPEPVTLTADAAVEINEEIKLECASASVPAATYTWKFNGTKLAVTTREYVIDKAVYSNTGTYTCEAHNAVTGKTQSKSHFVSVKEEGALDPVGLSDGAIAGIVIGVLAAVALAIGLFIYCRQKVPLESPY